MPKSRTQLHGALADPLAHRVRPLVVVVDRLAPERLVLVGEVGAERLHRLHARGAEVVVDDVEDHGDARARARRRPAAAAPRARRSSTAARTGRRRRSPSRARPGNSATGISSIAVTPSSASAGEVLDRRVERALARERADVQLVDDELVERRRASHARRPAAGRTTRDGPRSPSGCQREHGSGSSLAVDDVDVVVAVLGSASTSSSRRSRRRRARGLAAQRSASDSARGAQTRKSTCRRRRARPSGRSHGNVARALSSSGTSQSAASGGSVISAENGWPCHGIGSASTPPRLPTSVPP